MNLSSTPSFYSNAYPSVSTTSVAPRQGADPDAINTAIKEAINKIVTATGSRDSLEIRRATLEAEVLSQCVDSSAPSAQAILKKFDTLIGSKGK
ncbi:MAG: hypothetical protein ACKO34_09430 [Vampirovibrionales bacterium]